MAKNTEVHIRCNIAGDCGKRCTCKASSCPCAGCIGARKARNKGKEEAK